MQKVYCYKLISEWNFLNLKLKSQISQMYHLRCSNIETEEPIFF